MDRNPTLPLPQFDVVPLGTLEPGDVVDLGVLGRVERVAPAEDDGCARVLSLPEGYELRVPVTQIACARRPRSRRCA